MQRHCLTPGPVSQGTREEKTVHPSARGRCFLVLFIEKYNTACEVPCPGEAEAPPGNEELNRLTSNGPPVPFRLVARLPRSGKHGRDERPRLP
jgi:hypothetical protein